MKNGLRIWIVMIGLFYAIAAESKTTTFPSPGACSSTLQQCIDAASSGDVILLAIFSVDEDLVIGKSLTLQPAVGNLVPPVIGGGGVTRDLVIQPGGGPIKVTLNQLNFSNVILDVGLFQDNGHIVTISNSTFLGGSVFFDQETTSTVNFLNNKVNSNTNFPVVLNTFAADPSANLTTNIIGNWITGLNVSDAVELFFLGAGNAYANVKSNVIHNVGSCNCGAAAGILVAQDPSQTVHAIASIVNNTLDHVDMTNIRVHEGGGVGSLSTYVYNNIMSNSIGQALYFPLLTQNLAIAADHNDTFNDALPDHLGGYALGPYAYTTDPLYKDAANHNYDLNPQSGCITSGTNDPGGSGLPLTDAEDKPRVIYGYADIGAYEAHNDGIAEFLPFYDLFKDHFLNPDYQYLKGTWLADGANLVSNSKGKGQFLVGTGVANCDQCTVEATMRAATRPHGGSSKLWLIGWYMDKKNDVELMMNETGNQWELVQRVNGHKVSKTKITLPINPDQEYRVSITDDVINFVVRVDGQVIMTVPVVGFVNGTAGFQVKGTVGYFNDLFMVI